MAASSTLTQTEILESRNRDWFIIVHSVLSAFLGRYHILNKFLLNEKRNKHTGGRNWHVFMECHTSTIVMKKVLSLEAFLSTLTTRKPSLPGIPVETVVYDRPYMREIPECYHFLTQLQTHLAYLCLEDTSALPPQVLCTFYSLCLEFSSLYL